MAAKRDAALSAELTWRRRLGMALDAARGACSWVTACSASWQCTGLCRVSVECWMAAGGSLSCLPTPHPRPAPAGMVYLHTRTPPIIHRDLKSPNLVRRLGRKGGGLCGRRMFGSCPALPVQPRATPTASAPCPFHPTPQLVDDSYHCKVSGACPSSTCGSQSCRAPTLP